MCSYCTVVFFSKKSGDMIFASPEPRMSPMVCFMLSAWPINATHSRGCHKLVAFEGSEQCTCIVQ